MDYKKYGEKLVIDSGYLNLFQDEILSLARDLPRDTRILEVGTGAGYLMKDLQQLGFTNLFSADEKNYLSSDVCDPQSITVYEVDLNYHEVSAKPESFDLIVSIQVIEHVENPWHFMRECKRLLRTGGQLWLSFPTSKDINSRIKFLKEGNVLSYTKTNNHISFFTSDIQTKLFNGFDLVKTYYSASPRGVIRFYILRRMLQLFGVWEKLPKTKFFSYKDLFILEKKIS